MNTLSQLQEADLLSSFDVHFARFLSGLADRPDPDLDLAFALARRVIDYGSICLDLDAIAGTELAGEIGDKAGVKCPDLDTWLGKLRESTLVGDPGQSCPLVLDSHHRLYLHRYWAYEQALAAGIRQRVGRSLEHGGLGNVADILSRLFPGSSGAPDGDSDGNRRQLAVLTPLVSRFSVVSGGPGTGKTTMAARILAMLVEVSAKQDLRIFLASPTGKAAAGLKASIQAAKGTLNCSDAVKRLIPDEAYTIHRLLGSIPGSPYFRYHAGFLLPADILMIDETSMVDLALMSKLVQALSPDASLILMGDEDQLASVETGNVLGDICNRGRSPGYSSAFSDRISDIAGRTLIPAGETAGVAHGLGDCIVNLERSFRFGDRMGIGGLSRAINSGNAGTAIELLRNPRDDQIGWQESDTPASFHGTLSGQIVEGFAVYLKAQAPDEALRLLNQCRILCAVRRGMFGVERLNRFAELVLHREGLIDPDNPFYSGRPLLITRNSYDLGLFNGDTGVVWTDPGSQDTGPSAFFSDGLGGLRRVSIHRLPEHETAYAMTVHKSQGAEFDRVHLILPEKDTPLLTRELLYTGMTRAREQVTFWGSEELLRRAISRKSMRTSGLQDALWGTV